MEGSTVLPLFNSTLLLLVNSTGNLTTDNPPTTTFMSLYDSYLDDQAEIDFFYNYEEFLSYLSLGQVGWTYDDLLDFKRIRENNWLASESDKILLYLFAAVITFFGTTLNLLVILIFLIGKRSSTKEIRILLINLAIVDFIWSASAPIGYTTLDLKLNFPEGQQTLCSAFRFFTTVAAFGSPLFTAAIAFERLLVVCFPIQARKVPHKHTVRLITAILLWISLGVIYHRALTTAKVVRVRSGVDSEYYTSCISYTVQPASDEITMAHGMFNAKIKYWVCTGIVVLCYAVIVVRLMCRKKIGETTNRCQTRNNIKILKMLMLMSALNILYWIPESITGYLDWKVENPSRPKIPRGYWYIYTSCSMLTMSSTMISPILYLILNKDFKDDTKDLLKCYCSSRWKVANSRISPSNSAITMDTNLT